MSFSRKRHPLFLAAIGLAALQGCQSAPGARVPTPSAYQALAGELLVKYAPDVSAAEQARVRDRFHVTAPDPLLPGIERWRLAPDAASAAVAGLAHEAAVQFVQPNYTRRTLAYQSSDSLSSQWYLTPDKGLDMPSAWSKTTVNPPGSNVIVAIVDTGIDTSHPDLQANLIPDDNAPKDRAPWGKKFIDEVGDGVKTTEFPNGTDVNFKMRDGNGHGTHVAGIVGAVGNNGIGITGVAPGVKLLPVKAMRADGDGDDFTIAKALKAAADAGADVINLSVGGPAPSPILAEAIAYDFSKGSSVVIASGNGYGLPVYYPAAYSGVIAVGATTTDRKVASYSNVGPQLAVVAPGGNTEAGGQPSLGIYSTLPTYPNYLSMNLGKPLSYGVQVGTSMATPMVTGAVALVISEAKAHGQHLTPAQVRTRLLASTTPLGNESFSNSWGYGMVNPAQALSWVSHDGSGQ
ncbi:MAG TPA: S8 family serine peptidase [Stenomitos sp.]